MSVDDMTLSKSCWSDSDKTPPPTNKLLSSADVGMETALFVARRLLLGAG